MTRIYARRRIPVELARQRTRRQLNHLVGAALGGAVFHLVEREARAIAEEKLP